MILSLKSNKNNWFSFQQKNELDKDNIIVSLVIQTTCIFWIATKMICWRLWTIERLFPTAPPFDFLVAPAAVHFFLFGASILLMFALVFKPSYKILLICLFISELLSCLLDQSRWQPWEYQFIFTVFINIINYKKDQRILDGVAFVMISTYFYSGLGKFNPGFLVLVWDNLFLKRYFKINPSVIHQTYVYYSGYLLALTELLMGIGLCFIKTQKISAWTIIVMHIVIIIIVGPWGLKYNISVWPWNVLMMVHLFLIFIYKKEIKINFRHLWERWSKIVIICWGFLPMLNHTVGWWDNFLSSRLFAGNQPQMDLCLKDSSEIKQLKPYINRGDLYNICSGDALVNLQSWAMKEMKSPPYTEARALKKIARKWISEHKGTRTKAILYFHSSTDSLTILPQ